MVEWKKEISQAGIDLSLVEIGLRMVATIDPRGWPHLTLLSFSRAKSPTEVVWGQFTEGLSKKYVRMNPKQGLFFMNGEMPFSFFQVKVNLDHIKQGGEDCEFFSRQPMLRYMTYTNVHTCYYNKVLAATEVRALPLGGIVKGMLGNLWAKTATKTKGGEQKIEDIGSQIFNGLTTAKLICYIDSDGYPVVYPCFQMRSPDRNKIVFNLMQFGDELKQIPIGSHVSLFGAIPANMELLDQMINGTLTGFKKYRGVTFGIIEIDEVYKCMPPLTGVIYPEIQVREKVTDFHL